MYHKNMDLTTFIMNDTHFTIWTQMMARTMAHISENKHKLENINSYQSRTLQQGVNT